MWTGFNEPITALLQDVLQAKQEKTQNISYMNLAGISCHLIYGNSEKVSSHHSNLNYDGLHIRPVNVRFSLLFLSITQRALNRAGEYVVTHFKLPHIHNWDWRVSNFRVIQSPWLKSLWISLSVYLSAYLMSASVIKLPKSVGGLGLLQYNGGHGGDWWLTGSQETERAHRSWRGPGQWWRL